MPIVSANLPEQYRWILSPILGGTPDPTTIVRTIEAVGDLLRVDLDGQTERRLAAHNNKAWTHRNAMQFVKREDAVQRVLAVQLPDGRTSGEPSEVLILASQQRR